jgi:hypothetical protein
MTISIVRCLSSFLLKKYGPLSMIAIRTGSAVVPHPAIFRSAIMTEPDQDDGLARLENIVNNIRACLSDGPQAKGLERLLNKMSVCLDGLDGAAGDRFSPIVGEISIVLRKVR